MAQNFFLPGQIIMVKKAGVIDHEGLVVHGNRVIHNSPQHGGVVLSAMEDFAGDQAAMISDKYSPRVSRDQIIINAYAAVGKKKWLPWYNCQHFISEIAGLPPHSRQVKQAVPFFLIFCLALGLRKL